MDEQHWIADLLLDYLELEGVEHVFGVPGGPLTSFFEALARRKTIQFVLARHEGGAAFMANASARARRSLAVCCVTSGPGATNAITGVAGAMRDSLPVLYLTGQVATQAFGKGAIQESTSFGTDLVAMLRPVTKLSAAIDTANNAETMIRSALRAALTGRWGPVHLSLAADVARQPSARRAPATRSYRATGATVPDAASVAAAARLLVGAARPCIYAGHGTALAAAEPELARVAERLGAPVVTTPKGKGAFPEDHPLSLGVFGMGGHPRAHAYVGTHDVLLVVGSSLGEFSTGAWDERLRPSRALVQIDVDANEVGRNYDVDVPLLGDAKAALAALDAELARHDARAGTNAALAELRESVPAHEAPPRAPRADAIAVPALVQVLREAMPDDGMLFVDNGNSILWGGHYWQARAPGTYWIDLGVASMGSAVAGVVGGKLARPGQCAVALVGDAAFAMNGFEVHTAVELGLQIVWVVLNNAAHGMVASGEELLLGRDLGFGHFRREIDFAALAQSLGARGVRVGSTAALRDAMAEALRAPGPTVIDAIVDGAVPPPTLARRAASLARFFSLRVDGGPSTAPAGSRSA